MNKKIIITLPHFNNPKGLLKTILSINESITIDIIIVDDGSTHKLDEKGITSIYKYGKIYFQYLDKNQGVGVAANACLDFAIKFKYELIARLDAGDICYKDKFGKQVQYLEKNPEIKLLGTWARVLDSKGKHLYDLKHPIDYKTIKQKMYFNSMFLNPSVMFYSHILNEVGGYPYKYRRAAQDYAFFFKIIKRYKAENYPEILLDYVTSNSSISSVKRKLQVYHRIRIILDNFYFGIIPIYAIVRNLILLIIPINILTFIKSKLYR